MSKPDVLRRPEASGEPTAGVVRRKGAPGRDRSTATRRRRVLDAFRRLVVLVFAAAAFGAVGPISPACAQAPEQGGQAQQGGPASGAEPAAPVPSLFDQVSARARALAAGPYQPLAAKLPEALAEMGYQQYRSIRFRGEQALWRDQGFFEVQLFHPGFLYREPVTIHTVRDGQVQTLPFSTEFFRYEGEAAAVAAAAPQNTGFAGFRVHYPLNSKDYKDELVAFLGASYFRLVGPGQIYGLSARGLAVDTAEPGGEEFPAFREFWLVQPAPDATRMTLYALLDSPSVTGAYRFDLRPGSRTWVDVEARLFARRDVRKLGIAPLTSMYHHGRSHTRFVDDFRPQVHDSDGLLANTARGEWIWRPLSNPKALRVSSFQDEDPRGFGLLQRDRDFDNYLDLEAHYERRPSHWITPLDKWGKGRVELVEIPTPNETNDNVVTYWVPAAGLKAGESATYRYRITAFGESLPQQSLAQVVRTRVGSGKVPGSPNSVPRSARRFVVDFRGEELASLSAGLPVEASVSAHAGKIEDLVVQRLPDGATWRASFKLTPDERKPADMRMFLQLYGQRLSETWSYVWYADDID